jgi:death-on-curing protein
MNTIDEERVRLYHRLIIEQTGGSFEVRDNGLLNSALNNVFATFDKKDLYQTKCEKGARLGFNLVSNHAFVDGNKRIGMHIMILFLELNGIYLDYTQKELIELGLDIADGKFKYEDVLEWVTNHKKSI